MENSATALMVTTTNSSTVRICRRTLLARTCSAKRCCAVLGAGSGVGSTRRTGRPHRQRAMSPTLSAEYWISSPHVHREDGIGW